MHIDQVIERHDRHTFTARYKCEHCGYEVVKDGHDAAEFYAETLPAMRCEHCDRSAIRALGYPYRARITGVYQAKNTAVELNGRPILTSRSEREQMVVNAAAPIRCEYCRKRIPSAVARQRFFVATGLCRKCDSIRRGL